MTDGMADLRDSRAKLTELGDQVLVAVALAEGRDKSSVLREVVHRWAMGELKRSQTIVRLSHGVCEGTAAPDKGD